MTSRLECDLGFLVHEVRFGKSAELHFWREPQTRLISVEMVDRGSGKHLGWLAKRIKPETIRRKFDHAFDSMIIGE